MIKKGDIIKRRTVLDEVEEYQLYYVLSDTLSTELNLPVSNKYYGRNYLCLNLTAGIFDRSSGGFRDDYNEILLRRFGIPAREIPYGILVTDNVAERAFKTEIVPEKELLEFLRAKVNHPYLFR